jgi:hypothetical protein
VSLQLPFRRTLAALLLPASLIPVLLLAPSLARAPMTLWRKTAHALAPAHHAIHREAPGPRYYLVGPARLEIEVLEGSAGTLTPKVGVSPFAEPEAAARAAAGPNAQADRPIVLIAPGRELTTASGQPLIAVRRLAHAAPNPARAAARAVHATSRPAYAAARPAHKQ